MNDVIISSWNVNSINVRLQHVLDWLEKNKPNVLCLQEIKTVDEKFPRQAFEDAGYHCEIFGEKTYNGVAIISTSKPDAVQRGFLGEKEPFSRRFLEATFGNVHVLDVYIPNGQAVGSEKFFYKLNWLKALKNHLETEHKPSELLAICGDYNIAPEDRDVYDPMELKDQILFSGEEKDALKAIQNWGLVDSFRLFNDEAGHYSWWDYRMNAFRRKMGLRIDHIWVTEPLSKRCTASWIDMEPRKLEKPSDHAPIAAKFDL